MFSINLNILVRIRKKLIALLTCIRYTLCKKIFYFFYFPNANEQIIENESLARNHVLEKHLNFDWVEETFFRFRSVLFYVYHNLIRIVERKKKVESNNILMS